MSKHTKKRQNTAAVPQLKRLLSYRRPHGSPGEKQFILDHILPLNPDIITAADGEAMAFFCYVGTSKIMFTSHTDTVHMNSDKIWQDVHLEHGIYFKKDNQPLGADDAAGVWLMLHMIHAKVPGVYAFFRGEERGGIGSTWCAKHRQDLFKDIDCAIAFDRRGTTSVITHQAGTRGCSDKFAQSLCKVLGMAHKIDTTGIYTDTKEFFDLVPNCTNLSVGYEREHSKFETLDDAYIRILRGALIAAPWDKLDHTPPDPDRDDLRPTSRQSLWFQNGIRLDDGRQNELHFDEDYDDIDALNIAEFLFDYADRLPTDLCDNALLLAQNIFKRFE